MEMPKGYAAEKLLDRILVEGKVLMISGPAFAVNEGEFTNCFRLNFSMPTHEQIRQGVDVINRCVRDYLNEQEK